MNFNLDVRLKQLESLEQYISSSRDKVQSILDCLKWNTKEIMQGSQLIRCSIDPSHRVPVRSVDQHVKSCSLRKEGYNIDDGFLSEPLHNLNSSILIDDHKKIEILSAAHRSIPDFKSGWNGQDPDPKTADRLVSTFSADERSTLYSYAVAHTVGPPELPEFNTMQPLKSDDKPLTVEELRIRERDAKRRRIKYRAVHTNRKSYKEVLREVIDGQMELYVDWLMPNGVSKIKLEQTDESSETNRSSIKNKHEQNCEHQKNQYGSERDAYERGHSVVSKNSTYSGSSKSTKSHYKDKHRENDKHNHKRHRDSSSSSNSRYSRRRRRSEDRSERRKRNRSYSRHSRDSRSRCSDSKVR